LDPADTNGSAAFPVLKGESVSQGTEQTGEPESGERSKEAPGILLADDHVIVREAFRTLLEKEGFRVVAEASNGREAVQRAAELRPVLAILDLSMPVMNGLDACREILRVSPQTNVIVLTIHMDQPYVLEALIAGARGYALKTRGTAALITAIRQVLGGEFYLSPAVANTVVQAYLEENMSRDCLSGRERQVVQLIAEGMATKEIAAMLDISVKTAESHRNRIMRKLNIHDTAGIVRYAVRRGLTEA
jgi:two-component system, NarL family, response regulator NreC